MNYHEFEEILQRGVEEFGLVITKSYVEQLYLYFVELCKWSKKINLIARETDENTIVENHFIDSLSLLMMLEEHRDYLVDVGTGAGFPGLVCKIACPEMRVSLVEPRLKRISFLKHVIRTCSLDKIKILPVRLESTHPLEDEKDHNCIVSRAVTNIPEFLNMCNRYHTGGKRIICMKGPKYKDELEAMRDQQQFWQLTETREYSLPYSGASRALLCFTPH